MAGETIKSEGVCLAIHPFSRTSHIVRWLTPEGKVTTIVKGAERPKSFFLGQYDLNYTCEIVYYARAKGEVHVLRDAVPIDAREYLRDDYRRLIAAEYFRARIDEFASVGDEARAWYELLVSSFGGDDLKALLAFDIKVLRLLGQMPSIKAEGGSLTLRGERTIPVSREVASCIWDVENEKFSKFLLDADRVISVYYQFCVDGEVEFRRSVQKIISKPR